MENASQALLIAAGVLVGILILSLGIALMNMMGGYAANTQNRIDENKISQFNNKFLRYDGLTNLKIQDIITVKNYALENNKQYSSYNFNTDRAKDNNDYIDVYFANTVERAKSENSSVLIFNKNNEELLKAEIEKLFTCEVKVNTTTGKVHKVYFYETR